MVRADVSKRIVAHRRRQSGVAAIISMMFLVIFGSLAAAMSIVAQGNLSTADAHLKINRALAASETGMNYIIYRLNEATAGVTTTDGLIDADNAPDLWVETRTALLTALASDVHNLATPNLEGSTLHVGPIAVGPDEPTFSVTFTPHPLTGENYDSAYYGRAPYSGMDPPVSATDPLDATWIRIRVEASDGPESSSISRSIQMDFKIDKKIRFALLSRSRVMIGRNVMIEGPVGSRFTDTHLPNGHPVQIRSDFRGLNDDLDEALDALNLTIVSNDIDGDNRLNLASDAEIEGLENPHSLDADGDGFIDEFDYFLVQFDGNGDGAVSGVELGTASSIEASQLLELIDTFGHPNRDGYDDGVINHLDRYAKIRGKIMLTAAQEGWNDGAADGNYQDHLYGPVHPDHGDAALTFEAGNLQVHEFEASDFDVSGFRALATGVLSDQAELQAAQHDPSNPDSPGALGNTVLEAVPFGAAHPYDYYVRPIYENMTFTNVRIPKGNNALFRNCTFIGLTFIETASDNDDANFNLAGGLESDGSPAHPDKQATVNGAVVTDTKTVSNNVRFEDCTFEGALVSGDADGSQPAEFTQVRNKVSFTGNTRFEIEDSTNLDDDEKQLYLRSTILAPHYSIEMGSFIDPADPGEVVELSGTIVSGVVDMRGQVKIDGTLLTTFEPLNDTGPVISDTSPQFNTTIGYFESAAGDLEAEIPEGGIGVIQVRYNENIPLPDGILGPIEIRPIMQSYFEGGGQ
ncbi:MAG: hypothetical protein CMJ18_02800 [Phycisphaeraceae bacterium]|nr:hypothetical protein [Phycisphaeraceae bacterium]